MIVPAPGRAAWFIVVVALACVPAAALAPYDAAAQHREHAFAPPGRRFLLGSDQYGRDLLSRVLVGARTSAQVALTAVALALSAALVVGAAAAWYRGWRATALSGAMELFVVVPWWYLVLALRACLPLVVTPAAAVVWIALSLALAAWARPAQIVRAIVAAASSSEHVMSARAAGASDVRIIWRHLAPSAAAALFTSAGILLPRCVFAEVTMSFLGLGIPEPTPSWGNVLAGATRPAVLVAHPWMLCPVAAVGGALSLLALAASRAGRQS